jgi:hypothetical protein
MINPTLERRKKLFRVARLVQNRLYTHPEIALRGARRLSKIINGQPPFQNVSNTAFETETGNVRAI